LFFIEKKEDACNTLKKFAKEFPENKLKIKAENKKKSLKCVSLTE
jgi:TolA-binding protein